MENLQELKVFLEGAMANADKKRNLYRKEGDKERLAFYVGKAQAFDNVLTEVQLLLTPKSNSDTQPQLNKHDVSRRHG